MNSTKCIFCSPFILFLPGFYWDSCGIHSIHLGMLAVCHCQSFANLQKWAYIIWLCQSKWLSFGWLGDGHYSDTVWLIVHQILQNFVLICASNDIRIFSKWFCEKLSLNSSDCQKIELNLVHQKFWHLLVHILWYNIISYTSPAMWW